MAQANFSMIQSQSRMEQEQRDMETLLSTFAESTGDQQDQSFSQDDNVVPKKKDEVEKTFHTEGLSNLILTKIILLLTFYHFSAEF